MPVAETSMDKVLVFFPTYNEAGNVKALVRSIREFLPGAHLLVVDDASPDGTGEILDALATEADDLTVLHRPGKLGVGSAHKLAMLYARDRGYDALITMDADFSHHPRYLPEFLPRLEHADFVTGSRYVEGGACDYGPRRVFLSRTANFAAKLALGLHLQENTTLYRGFTRDLLERMDIDAIRSEGYSFAVESLYQVSKITDRLDEFPIHFENRAAGRSKISQAEIYKAVLTIERLAVRRAIGAPLARLLGRDGPKERPTAPLRCRLCGSPYHVEVYPEREGGGVKRALQDASPYACATHTSRSHGQVLKCLQCGLVFIRPKLDDRALVEEYAGAVDPTYLEHIDARETTFRYNLDRIRGYIGAQDRVLEVGSYCGGFLKVARDEGIDVTGVEPSGWAVKASRELTDAPVYEGTLDDLPSDIGRFDVVVAWDVLEHFADPVAELKKMHALLVPNGTLLFSTLMIDNWFPRLAGRQWPWLMDMHLYYFTEASIRNTVKSAGFEMVDSMKYCHVVTLEYLLEKVGTLGLPGADAAAKLLEDRSIGRRQIPFRFGDIKLFVCRKAAVASDHRASDRGSERAHA